MAEDTGSGLRSGRNGVTVSLGLTSYKEYLGTNRLPPQAYAALAAEGEASHGNAGNPPEVMDLYSQQRGSFGCACRESTADQILDLRLLGDREFAVARRPFADGKQHPEPFVRDACERWLTRLQCPDYRDC